MKNKFLIVLVIIIILFIGALSYYRYFMWKKDTNVNENNNDNADEENYTASGESEYIKDFPYWLLINGTSKVTKDISALDMTNIGYNALNDSLIKNYDVTDTRPITDSSGATYPVYDDETALTCSEENRSFGNIGKLKKVWQSLNFTVAQIDKMDKSIWACVWSDGGGYDNYYVADKKDIDAKLIEMFGTDNNIFDNSFVYNTNYDKQFICGIGYYVYDKTVEKLIYWPSGGCTAGIADKTYVLSEEKLNDELTLNIVDVHFDNNVVGQYPREVKIYKSTEFLENPNVKPVSTLTINNEKEETKIYVEIKKSKDKLDNYTLTFKKVEDNYQFVRIDYVK